MGDCPWDGWAPGGTVTFCEARVCGWVVEPSNAWSNLAYIVIGLFLLRANGSRWDRREALVAPLAIVMGLASFLFHASGTHLGEVVDDTAMYGLSSLFISNALSRWRGWSHHRTLAVFLALWGLSALIRINMTVLGIPFFATQLIAFTALENHLGRRHPGPHLRWLWALGGVFAFSFAMWTLDATRILCHPDNHFLTGHAVWHLGTATCLWIYYRFLVALPDTGSRHAQLGD